MTLYMENNVWYYRKQHNWTLKHLSRLTGISVSELNKLENGLTKDIGLNNAMILSKILQVDIYELFCLK